MTRIDRYIQEFTRLAADMSTGIPSETQDPPADYSDKLIGYIKDAPHDEPPPLGKHFGDVTPSGDARPVYNHKAAAHQALVEEAKNHAASEVHPRLHSS